MGKIKFGPYEFEGPYTTTRQLYDKPGVYLILCNDIREPSKFYPVDVGESETPKSAIEHHDRKVCWTKSCHGTGTLALAVFYAAAMTKEERIKVAKYIRGLYDIPCGQ